jgi:hypothetical protein
MLAWVGPVFATLALVGVVHAAWRRRWVVLLLGLGPWALALVANLYGLWPYGAFRTNLFLLLYPLLLGVCGLQALWSLARRAPPWVSRVLGGGLLSWVVLLLLVDPTCFTTKPRFTRAYASVTHRALDDVITQVKVAPRTKRPLLLLDGAACANFDYYTKKHPTYAPHFREAKLNSRVARVCFRYAEKHLKRGIRKYRLRGFYLVTAGKRLPDWVIDYTRDKCAVDFVRVYPSRDVLLHCTPFPATSATKADGKKKPASRAGR